MGCQAATPGRAAGLPPPSERNILICNIFPHPLVKTARVTMALGHTTNLVGIPTGLLASAAYNDYPVPLRIAGVRETNHSFFRLLDAAADSEEAACRFQDYMGVVFGIEQDQRQGTDSAGVRRFRSSYLRLLKGWGYDSNSREGAVLKGWVESRFGLFPTFHKEAIIRYASGAWIGYVEEKMASRFHNNSIYMQLDLLYEFCQSAAARFFFTGRKTIPLYRGVNDFVEHLVVERIYRRTAIIRLNNLNSFSGERDIASQFGDNILEARVPVSKLLFFNQLLPRHPLKGEAEFLVIGGDYRVTSSYL